MSKIEDMTIKDLKEKIKDLPDDMKIGDTGHFGEYLECLWIMTEEVEVSFDGKREEILLIKIQDAGNEPD